MKTKESQVRYAVRIIISECVEEIIAIGCVLIFFDNYVVGDYVFDLLVSLFSQIRHISAGFSETLTYR